MRKIHIDDNEINPSIRKAGMQDNIGWSFGRRLYDYEMLYVTNGTGTINVDGQKYKLSRGSLILIPPDTSSGLSLAAPDLDVVWVHFDFIFLNNGEEIDDYDQHLTQKHLVRPRVYFRNGYTLPYHIKVEDKKAMSKYFHDIHDTYCNSELFWQLRCKSILLEILYQIIRQIYADNNFSDNLTVERLVQDMRQYMYTHYTNKLTLLEIANYAGVSHNYANKIFKDITGDTIINHLNKYRIKKAIHLIKDSGFTMEQIAEEVGFSNTYYFSRVMKKLTGKSPTYYKHD